MRGHVRKRGKKWAFVIDVGRDPETGRRKQRWHSGYSRKQDAVEALNKALGKLNDGDYVEPSKLTLREYMVDQWLPAIRATVRPTTWESYERIARVYIIPEVGGVRLQQLTGLHLDILYAKLLAEGAKRGGGLSPRSARYVHAVVHRALGAAVKSRLLTRNVGDDASPPSVKAARDAARRSMRVWTADQLASFLHGIADHRLYPLFVVLSQTGMRRGEALGLAWEDLDLKDAPAASVQRTLIVIKHKIVESQPKTDNGRRMVSLDPATVRVLRDWRKTQLRERMAIGPAWADTGRVFTREDGADLHPEQVTDLFDRLVAISGLPRIRLHDLRHTHATLALKAGVHPKVVQERLGHANISMTLDIYSHATPAMQADAAATVAALVGLPT